MTKTKVKMQEEKKSRTFPVCARWIEDCQNIDGATAVRRGEDDFRVDTDFLAQLVPVLHDCVCRVDYRSVHVEQLLARVSDVCYVVVV